MSYQLIRDGLHALRNAFDFAHPAKPTKGFLSAELAKLKALVEGLPDDEAPAAAAPAPAPAPDAGAQMTPAPEAIGTTVVGKDNMGGVGSVAGQPTAGEQLATA